MATRRTHTPIDVPGVMIVLAGVWLIVSPWIVYEDGDPWWIPMVFGVFVAGCASAQIARAPGLTFLNRLNVGAGISLFATGFGIPDSSQAAWNVWIVGALVFALAVLSVAQERRPTVADGQR